MGRVLSRQAPITRERIWPLIAGLASLALFLTTVQWTINGSPSPYATDVGEIQNALPRWGTIHFTGYPLYTLLGSAFVTLWRLVGVQPAAGASLYSALWGALAIAWLALLAQDLGVEPPWAALCSLIAALSLSNWIDASIAEVHTATMLWSVASLHLALRYGRGGARRDLLWLTFAFTQGVAHQRAVAFLAPGLLAAIWPQRRGLVRNIWPVLGVACLAPLTYLYLPLRAWQGADWTFNEPGTWRGFWTMIGDTKSGRIVSVPASLAELRERVALLARLLRDDLPWPLLGLGLLGLTLPFGRRQARPALTLLLVVGAYVGLCLIVWEGRISDALLAVKLPIVYAAALGLGLWTATVPESWRIGRAASGVLLALCVLALFFRHRPQVLAITRDPAAEHVIATVERIDRSGDRPITLMALWGHDYWALAYAQAYRGQLDGLRIVDHNAPLGALAKQGERIMTLEKTFYQRPLSWWEDKLGGAHLSAPTPGIIEVRPQPQITHGDLSPGASLALGNGLEIATARLEPGDAGTWTLEMSWRCQEPTELDYSVAVHLLAHDPPRGAEDILAQADRQHPVGGWYPTSRWSQGELVEDCYVIAAPEGAQPVGVRVGMYRVVGEGRFENTAWLTLPIP